MGKINPILQNRNPERVLPPGGGYQTLPSHQKSGVIDDITHRFAHKSLSRGVRTTDQMIRSAAERKNRLALLRPSILFQRLRATSWLPGAAAT
jgi:hypothetical protein